MANVNGLEVAPAVVCLQFPNLGQMQEANAATICALHNEYPALSARIRELEKERDEYKKCLALYAENFEAISITRDARVRNLAIENVAMHFNGVDVSELNSTQIQYKIRALKTGEAK